MRNKDVLLKVKHDLNERIRKYFEVDSGHFKYFLLLIIMIRFFILTYDIQAVTNLLFTTGNSER